MRTVLYRLGRVLQAFLEPFLLFALADVQKELEDDHIVLGHHLLELIDRKPNGRQPGFTKACRIVLMEARGPLGAREVCQELERRASDILLRHKDPMASVTTVLNRLVDYGEARSLTNDRGRRVWEWVSETDTGREPMAAQASL